MCFREFTGITIIGWYRFILHILCCTFGVRKTLFWKAFQNKRSTGFFPHCSLKFSDLSSWEIGWKSSLEGTPLPVYYHVFRFLFTQYVYYNTCHRINKIMICIVIPILVIAVCCILSLEKVCFINVELFYFGKVPFSPAILNDS